MAERIADHCIEAGRHQHQLRVEFVRDRHYDALECCDVVAVAHFTLRIVQNRLAKLAWIASTKPQCSHKHNVWCLSIAHFIPWDVHVESGAGSFAGLRVIALRRLGEKLAVLVPVQWYVQHFIVVFE